MQTFTYIFLRVDRRIETEDIDGGALQHRYSWGVGVIEPRNGKRLKPVLSGETTVNS